MAVQPGTYNITLQRRADYSVLLQFKDSNDAVIDLDGYTAYAQAWDVDRRTKYADFAIAYTDRSNGKITISLTDAQLLHRGQLLDEGPLGEVEQRLGLSGRYAITGSGEVDPKTLVDEKSILAFEQREHDWILTVDGPSAEVLKAADDSGVALTSWAPVRPNLVEWLCAATGMSVDDISLEVASSALLPMQSMEVRGDE